MTIMSDTRRRILLQLSDGAEHSGMAIAKSLGISRAAVWKHIKALQADGIEISSSTMSGYRIPGGLQLLDVDRVRHAINGELGGLSEIVLLDITTSTNDWLMSQIREQQDLSSGTVCLTERQTAGRGTRGRQWESPYGSNLYVSLYWFFDCGPVELAGLSLSMAAAIGKSLKTNGAETVKIKWPNDLYTDEGKFGGILIDMMAEVSGPSHVVIGAGLNIDMPEPRRSSIDQPVADLRNTGMTDTLTRNQLAAVVIEAMADACTRFADSGFAAFRQDWLSQDMIMGRQVNLISGDRVVTGEACGVDDMGAIELLTDEGRRAFSSGEVTLRLA